MYHKSTGCGTPGLGALAPGVAPGDSPDTTTIGAAWDVEGKMRRQETAIQIHDGLDFVEKWDVAPGQASAPAYTLRTPVDYVIGIETHTSIAAEFRDANGDPLDDATGLTVQKGTPQGHPIGDKVLFRGTMGEFNYERMRTEPDYVKGLSTSMLLKPHERLFCYLDIPEGSPGFSAEESHLTIGDRVSAGFGKPVYVRHLDQMSTQERRAARVEPQPEPIEPAGRREPAPSTTSQAAPQPRDDDLRQQYDHEEPDRHTNPKKYETPLDAWWRDQKEPAD